MRLNCIKNKYRSLTHQSISNYSGNEFASSYFHQIQCRFFCFK